MTTRTRIGVTLSILAALVGFLWGPVFGLPADAATRCQFDAYTMSGRHYVTVWARPDQDVAVRVNGRTLRKHTPRERVPGDVLVIFTTRRAYTPDQVRAYVNGHRCRWGVGLPGAAGFVYNDSAVLDPSQVVASSGPAWAEGLPPCEYEDGSGGHVPCYWDAGNRGNGRGCSYIIRADDSTDYGAAREDNHPDCQTAAGRARLRGLGGAPFCQFDAYGHEIGVTGYGYGPGAKVAARVNGRTLRGHLHAPERGTLGDGAYMWRTRGRYTQSDVVVRVNGHVCETT